MLLDITERKRVTEREKMLTREVEHRSNNLLAVIQSIVRRSFLGSGSLEQVRTTIEARLQSLARTHQHLSDADWSGVSLGDIAHSELEPFTAQVDVKGGKVVLSPEQAQNFSLALHELATNAVKYGALSSPSGKVSVYWSVIDNDSGSVLRLQWRERGGPAVAAPDRQGFGTALLKGAFAQTTLDSSLEGLSCEIALAL